jgi:hypothetical protein
MTPATAGTEAATPSTLILGLVPGIQPPRVGAVREAAFGHRTPMKRVSRAMDIAPLDPRDKPEDEGEDWPAKPAKRSSESFRRTNALSPSERRATPNPERNRHAHHGIRNPPDRTPPAGRDLGRSPCLPDAALPAGAAVRGRADASRLSALCRDGGRVRTGPIRPMDLGKMDLAGGAL